MSVDEKGVEVRRYTDHDEASLRVFLASVDAATYCHDPAWLRVLREGYGKDPYILLALTQGEIRGCVSICPMVSRLFGRRLVGLPFLDDGGILAADLQAEGALLEALLSESERLGFPLELRGSRPISGIPAPANIKVGMTLELPEGGEESYWKRLDAKVRNQVRKADKSGVTVHWGGTEELDDFYRVFQVNMRDLGSPVHARHFLEAVLRHVPGAEIGIAVRAGRCIGGVFRVVWGKTLSIPWASTLREERVHCPNNALYWEAIRDAFRQGCERVDFGRSSEGEGTYKFKRQWLAEPQPLAWYTFDLGGRLRSVEHASEGKLAFAQRIWARLPLPMANLAGPILRGRIPA